MKVSVLIPCFNAERWIDRAIKSALRQTYADTEVIVVDDGSTDGSLDIIRSYDGQIRWESGENRGGNHARNRLLELATGEWLQYLDADDYLSATKVDRQVQHLQAHPDTDIIYSPVLLEYWNADLSQATHIEAQDVQISNDPWTLLIRWRMPQTGGPLWKKLAIVAAGGWDEEQPCCQEAKLYLQLLKKGARFSYCDDSGAVYRQWSQETVCTRDPVRSILKRLEILDVAESHLQLSDTLTNEQSSALAEARMEIARSVYTHDAKVAHRVERKARAQLPARRLPKAAAFPTTYRIAYRLLGFGGAEWLASSTRRDRTAPSHS
ncbi:MAG: glycosyltransferase involved in cell wall biosynthesis [Verrucomicrobiales bacterium]|jgi:glycosyltransferase involved in cell wall biosynthesis